MTLDSKSVTKSVQNHVNLLGFSHQSMLSASSMSKDYPQHPARLRLSEPHFNRFHCLYWWFFMLLSYLFHASIRGFLTSHTAFSENLLQRVLLYICPSPDMDCLPDSRSTQSCLLSFMKSLNSFSLEICREALPLRNHWSRPLRNHSFTFCQARSHCLSGTAEQQNLVWQYSAQGTKRSA